MDYEIKGVVETRVLTLTLAFGTFGNICQAGHCVEMIFKN